MPYCRQMYLLLLCLLPHFSKAQTTPVLANRCDTIEYITSLIQADSRFEYKNIGITGASSKQFYRYAYLAYKLNADELIDIFRNSSGALKIYSFCALNYQAYQHINELTPEIESDSTEIWYHSGCQIFITTVKDFLATEGHNPWQEETFKIVSKLRNTPDYHSELFTFITSSNSSF